MLITSAVILLLIAVICAAAFSVIRYRRYLRDVKIPEMRVEHLEELEGSLIESIPSWVDRQLVDINGHGRTGMPLEAVRDIVIHYTGNPGTSAIQNREFFNKPDTGVCSHFLVGLDGEVIQCIPLYERSQASNNRNKDTISIEVCHPDSTGQFTDATTEALVRLTAWLIKENDLEISNVIRHYDITGKECPRFHVRNPEEWDTLLERISSAVTE